MRTKALPSLPSPEQVQAQISALEEELKALRRLLRAAKAAAKADEARKRRLQAQKGGPHAV
jgi:hypothetical protein